MNKKKMEKEIKIFSGKGDIKNSLISAGSNIIPEDSIINNKYDNLSQKQNPMEYNIKVNKKRVKKEISLKQVSSSKLNPFYFKNANFSPKKNTPSIYGNLSRNNHSSMAERSSFLEKDSGIDSSGSYKYSYVPGKEKNNSEYNSSQSKSSYMSNTVSEIEEDEKENEENENNEGSTNNSEWSKRFKIQLFDKFRKIVKKVGKKKNNDYNWIISSIQDGDDEDCEFDNYNNKAGFNKEKTLEYLIAIFDLQFLSIFNIDKNK